MNEKQITILKQNLTLKDGQPVTTSHQVAASFDKEHRNVLQAIDNLEDHKAQGMILTGVLYVNPASADTHDILNTCERPLNSLTEADLCPGSAVLEEINAAHR